MAKTVTKPKKRKAKKSTKVCVPVTFKKKGKGR